MVSEPPTVSPRTLAIVAIIVVGAFLYSVFVMAAPLAWVGALLPIAFLYLAWRFVLAVERIAAALEAGGPAAESVSGE